MKGKFVEKANKNSNYNNDIQFADGNTSIRNHLFIKNGKDSTLFQIGIYRKKPLDTIVYFKDDIKKYQKDEWFGNPGVYKYAANEAFFIDYYNYNLFKITPSKISFAYKIIFPAQNSLPADFMSNPAYVKKRFEYFQNNRRVFYGLGGAYLLDDLLYLKMNNMHYDKDQKRNLIHNVRTGETTSFQDLEPDSLSSYLPITDSGFGYDFENRGFLAFENDRFYTSYSSLAMHTFKERSAGKIAKYPALLENYFKVSDKKSNPVLVILKPKKN